MQVVVRVRHWVFPVQAVVDCVSADPAWKVEPSAFASECIAEVAVLLVVSPNDWHSVTASCARVRARVPWLA